jgi:hypothetical protein
MQRLPDWKKIRHDAYNTVYERRIGDAVLTIWYNAEPEAGVGVWMPTYRWMIARDGDDYTMTSRGSYESLEEAAQFAEAKLKELK